MNRDPPGGEGLSYKKDGRARRTFEGLKKTVSVRLRLFNFKRSMTGVSAALFRVLSAKEYEGDIGNQLHEWKVFETIVFITI